MRDGKCKACDIQEGCANCDNGLCSACLPGYFMNDNKVCTRCNNTMPVCLECTSANKCTKCDDNIALL